ncbi:MAG: EAL domain-containing protein, partial [Actinobacteria bacterium]|nr:EAL domain-containing protein [Actinomycetota bacterium]
VIAEGVETENQLIQLKAMECEYVQGFLFSEPLDNKRIINLLLQGKFDFETRLTHSSNFCNSSLFKN